MFGSKDELINEEYNEYEVLDVREYSYVSKIYITIILKNINTMKREVLNIGIHFCAGSAEGDKDLFDAAEMLIKGDKVRISKLQYKKGSRKTIIELLEI